MKDKGELMKRLTIGVVVGLVLVGLGLYARQLNRAEPGEAVADLGREHVPVGTAVEYNSNPPTSGSHYASWTKRGVYDEAIEDGYLIHSLEHGYVIISYRCEEECQQLKDSLKNFYEQHKQKRLIVVPRADLKTLVALTAWGRLLALPEWDEKQAEEFLRAWENRGPEKTME